MRESMSEHHLRWLALALAVMVAAAVSVPPRAEAWTIPALKHFLKLKIDPDMPPFSSSQFDVRVPIQVTDLPLNWRDAELVVGFVGLFWAGPKTGSGPWGGALYDFDSPHDMVGGCVGMVKKTGVLGSGSFQDVVRVPSRECRGVMTEHFNAVSYAVARKDGQCLLLGLGCGSGGTQNCPPLDYPPYRCYECPDDQHIFGGL